MNFLLQKKYKYKIGEPIQEVKAELQNLLSKRRTDFSVNLMGVIREDNTFTIKPKFSFAIDVLGVAQILSLIDGKLETENERTVIKVIVRPNYILLCLLYFLLLLFIFAIINLKNSSEDDLYAKPIVFFILLMFILCSILFSMKRMKRRFERALGIREAI
jgi:hypothetical protein